MLPPTDTALQDPTTRPYFLWWTDATVAKVYEPDDRLGWRLKPGAVARHVLPGDYDVTYHIDEFGRRVLPDANVSSPTVHVFGSSFTE